MHRKTIARDDLVEAVRRATQLSKGEATAMVKQVLDEITDCLERGENVLLSSFGSFVVRDKKSRMGRNPKTGDTRDDFVAAGGDVQTVRKIGSANEFQKIG